ncbi:MAG: prolyl-tRNA synthetase [Candidatus Omnitrophota bacterium]|jgi:prolyl-tRNA synthetase
MKYSQAFIPTLKENPQNTETLNHRLMIRAGLVRKLASGTYMYLPLGLRVLKKVELIIREEMDATGALELLLPAIHPAEIWDQTGRLDLMGEDMIRFTDRHGRANVLGPTHEEIITYLASNEVNTYKQLPLALYQIQTKFRDEMRPRGGVMRCREFSMKDAYSFHTAEECLDKTYEVMKAAYCKIFSRLGIKYHIVQADPGAMGGSGSQEFVLFSDAGEDTVVQYDEGDYVVSAEMASRRLAGLKVTTQTGESRLTEKHTPSVATIAALADFLKSKPKTMVKTILYKYGQSEEYLAVLVRGDHEVSEYKLRQVYPDAIMASPADIDSSGSAFGYSGPIGLDSSKFKLIIDEDVVAMSKMTVGANKRDHHFVGCTWLDFDPEMIKQASIGDFRLIVDGDEGERDGKPCTIHIHKAIELGHIFKLGTRYSKPLKAVATMPDGKLVDLIMGCYGIGVTRLIASAIEQSSTDKGIFWPAPRIAPFQIMLISTNMKHDGVREYSLKLYDELTQNGLEVLWDDRDLSAGIKFNDADLLGIPKRVVIGPKGIESGVVELKDLVSNTEEKIDIEQVVDALAKARH